MKSKSIVQVFLTVTAFIAMWFSGSLIYYDGEPVTFEQNVHLAITIAISLAIVLRAMTARGSNEDRLKQLLATMAILFGIYALLILIGRYYFLRSLLATAVVASLIFGLAALWVRSKREGVKTAIITSLVKYIPKNIGKHETIDSPASDFRRYDIILVDLHEPVSADWAKALSKAMLCGCRIRHIQDYAEELSGAVSIKHFELEHLPSTDHDSYIIVKRLIDIFGALILAPIAVPLILVAGLAIGVTSGRPIFYIQPRVGYGGSHFLMWKLRTMRPLSPNERDGAAVPGDNRITPVGRIIRRTRIDELPQLWNVLKGDMSLIGPRPEVVAFHNAYTEVEPKFAYRCLVRPGITGWAQINAPPSANAEEAIFKARYDLYYVKKQSLALDILIAIRTIWTVTHGGGVR